MLDSLLERFRQGDRLALSRLLSLLARGERSDEILARLAPTPRKPARVVALTGGAGVGKSSLTGKLIEAVRAAGTGSPAGLSIAVLACDPQSPLSGGALLGDRFRMPSHPDDGVFIRSLATPGGKGALAEHLDHMIRLLELPDDVLAMIDAGELSEGHGRAILQLRDRGGQRALARRAREEALSVRRTEALARATEPDAPPERRRPSLVPADALAACRELEDSLEALLRQQVRVKAAGRGARVEIVFDDLREAQALVARLSGRRAA